MKCKYRFIVHGRLRLDKSVPVRTRGWTFEIQIEKGLASHIDVIVPLPDPSDWPKIYKNSEPGFAAKIDLNTHHFPFIQLELRALQGLLGMFGLYSIDLDNPTIEWLPESDEERSQLPLFSWQTKQERLPTHQIRPAPFDIIARSIIAANAAIDIEIPLNFYRRGMLDIYEDRFIEAIYDFYFILESVFGNGKFKTEQIRKEFLSSKMFRSHLEYVIKNPSMLISPTKEIFAKFKNSYGKFSIEEAATKIINLRGELHHHSSKKKNKWHPENQRQYELDALFLQALCYNITFDLAQLHLWSKSADSEMESLIKNLK